MVIYKTNEELKAFSEERKERAAIMLNSIVPEKVDSTTYHVPSSDGSKTYTVSHIDSYSCDCPDFLQRCKGNGLYCKHIQAIILFNKLKNKVEMDNFDVDSVMDEKVCPKCKSEKIFKFGMRTNKSGTKQRYGCSACGFHFVLDPLKGIKGNARMVCLALDMYYKGNSLRDIQNTIYTSFGLKLHHETIRRWNNRFAGRINEYVATLKPQTGERMHIDEQVVRVKGENVWCWNALDNKTRFLLAQQLTKTRTIKDARNIIHKAKDVISQRPLEIATDKGPFYIKAIKCEFAGMHRYMTKEDNGRVLYHARHKIDNQVIERYHATYRERDKVIRGLKSGPTAERYIENWKTFYNFVRPHMTFNGLTPSEVAGINIGNGRNRWLGLIKLSA